MDAAPIKPCELMRRSPPGSPLPNNFSSKATRFRQRWPSAIYRWPISIRVTGPRLRSSLPKVLSGLTNGRPALKTLGLHSLGDTFQAIGDLDAAKTVYTEGLDLAQTQALPQEQAALAYYQQAADATPAPLRQAQTRVDEFGLLLATESWTAAEALATALPQQLKALPEAQKCLYGHLRHLTPEQAA